MITDGGDDYIYNGEDGRIFMNGDSIELGGGDNLFVNEGKLYADGASNVINMGYSYGEGGYSYGLFVNNGSSIHMDDGAADDALTIIGDFTGSGDVNVDANGATLSSDRLYIEGDVLAGTANTVNVNLLSLPSAADMLAGETIDIVSVSGSSSASNFALGSVHTTDTALFTTDYSLVYGGGDYALGFDVTGLSTAGILLSTAAPAVQNLWYGSLGTMYQRQGAERRFSADGSAEVEAAVGVWGRYYANDGAMKPDAERGNFGGGGGQNYDFSSNGLEIGVGYSFNEAWTIGVLAGTMEGDYKPEAGGKTDLDGNTIGAYLTYIHGNGFYADLSYRSFDFDGEVNNGSEVLDLNGDADGYSLEMGYGFKTESDLEIEPQLQYSSMSVSMDDVGYGSGDFELTDGDSSQFRLGVALRKSYQQDSGLWTPYAALSYVNISSASNSYVIGGALEGGVDTSGGSALLELGTDARYKAWVFNAGISMQDGGAYDFLFGGQLNVRYSW
jgi:outer membrane autotransporter protein